MAKNSTGQGGRGTPESRRKPVTIDLPAEEVARKQAAGDRKAASGAASAPQPEDAPEGAAAKGAMADTKTKAEAEAVASTEGASAEAPAMGASGGKPPNGGERGPAAEATIPSAFAQPVRKGESAPPGESRRETRAQSFVPLIAAAMAGGAVVALVVVILALAGFFRPPPEDGPDLAGAIGTLENEIASLRSEIAALNEAPAEDGLAPLREQLAALQESVGVLQSALAGSTPDEGALRQVQDRLAQLEESVVQATAGSPSNETGERLAARLNALAGEIDALKSAAPDLSSLENGLADLRQQVGALSSEMEDIPREDRIAALEAKLAEIGERAEKAAALGPAVAADGLAAALEAGRDFVSELAALENLGVDPEAIDALQPHAESGLPTLAEIRARFETEVAAVDLTPPVAEGTNALDRLIGSARGLVEVRPASPTAGTDPGAIVTRIRGALVAGDVKTALGEWETLPQEIKTATAGWGEAAKTRMAADDLVARLRAAALSRLDTEG